uniref:Uncharacterized protein n=1 Tax=Anguilla anguilla TaxID=7936 RepID=A0A0E9WXT9_ANGAN
MRQRIPSQSKPSHPGQFLGQLCISAPATASTGMVRIRSQTGVRVFIEHSALAGNDS